MITYSPCACNMSINIDDSDLTIIPGQTVQLNRFDTNRWVVQFGWYCADGNRETLGWYLQSCKNSQLVKPLNKTDLYDIYLVEG